MRLVDSIDAVKDFVKHLTRLVKEGKLILPKNSPNEEFLITEASRRLGISRNWLSQNLKLDREAPVELNYISTQN